MGWYQKPKMMTNKIGKHTHEQTPCIAEWKALGVIYNSAILLPEYEESSHHPQIH